MPNQPRVRAWMFTINNPDDDQVPSSWPNVKFATWQKEVGENGTLHLQGYVLWTKQHRLSSCKAVHPTAHWEPRQGTHDQAVAYCNKDDTREDGPWTVGEAPSPGRRSDLEAVKKIIDEGGTLLEVAEAHFGSFCRYNRGFQLYRTLKTPLRDFHTHTRVFWGPPGTGKTRRAAFEAGPHAFWLAPPNHKKGSVWWDGYDGHTDVVIDEFYGWLPFNNLLRLLDRQPFRVQTKGGTVNFVGRNVWITSNKPPHQWYNVSNLGALDRRLREPLGEIIEMDGPFVWEPPELEPAEQPVDE